MPVFPFSLLFSFPKPNVKNGLILPGRPDTTKQGTLGSFVRRRRRRCRRKSCNLYSISFSTILDSTWKAIHFTFPFALGLRRVVVAVALLWYAFLMVSKRHFGYALRRTSQRTSEHTALSPKCGPNIERKHVKFAGISLRAHLRNTK